MNSTPRFAAALGQPLGEFQAVPALVAGGIDGAGELALGGGQRRLEGGDPGGIDGLEVEPMVLQQPHIGLAGLEMGRIAKEIEEAGADGVVVDPGIAGELGELGLAVEAEGELAQGIGLVAGRGAIGEEAQAPEPEARIGLQPELQRAIATPQRLQQNLRRAGRGPGIDMAGGDQAGIGMAGLEPGLGLPIQDDHLMAVGRQIIGGHDPDDAAAQHDNPHASSPVAAMLGV